MLLVSRLKPPYHNSHTHFQPKMFLRLSKGCLTDTSVYLLCAVDVLFHLQYMLYAFKEF